VKNSADARRARHGVRPPTGTVHGDWPIQQLVRQSTSIDIDPSAPERLSWELVRLRQQGPNWVILSIARVFV
jgi:hypothetical protein